MPNLRLEKAIRLGLLHAEGKPIDEAVQIVIDCVELVIDAGAPESEPLRPGRDLAVSPLRPLHPSVTPPPRPVPELSDAFDDYVPIEALAPISGPPDKATVRVWWTMEDLQNKILSEAPTEMEVRVNDEGGSIIVYRNISQVSGMSPGILLGYGPRVANPAIPFPKESFWATTEKVDIASAVAKMRITAESMYRQRAPVATRSVAPKPLRFNIGADVE